MRTFALVIGLLGASILPACGSSDAGVACNAGNESCPCYPNKTCNGGLVCRSSLCVNLNDGSKSPAQTASSEQSNGSSSSAAGSSATSSRPSTADGGVTTNAGPKGSGDGGSAESSGVDASVPRSTGGSQSAGGAGGSSIPGSSGGSAGRHEVGCTPKCGDAECGPDPVCQTSCGECAAGLECQSGTCRARAPLSKNGGTCADNSDCASNNCGRDRAGERLCYGTLGPNEACTQAFDCNSGVCIPMMTGGVAQVCVDGLQACNDLGISTPVSPTWRSPHVSWKCSAANCQGTSIRVFALDARTGTTIHQQAQLAAARVSSRSSAAA